MNNLDDTEVANRTIFVFIVLSTKTRFQLA
jgi:hypothetical protein